MILFLLLLMRNKCRQILRDLTKFTLLNHYATGCWKIQKNSMSGVLKWSEISIKEIYTLQAILLVPTIYQIR